jgi:hypothetical protein
MEDIQFSLKIKHTKGATQTASLPAAPTVAHLKTTIEVLFNIPQTDQKLIHKGRILGETPDDLLTSKYNIKSGDMIMLIEKPKPALNPPSKPENLPQNQQQISNPIPTLNQPTSHQFIPNEETVSSLVAMGYPRTEIIPCLRAARNNADLAVEFLLSGIPDGAEDGDWDDEDSQEDANSDDEQGQTAAGLIGNLINSPQFLALREQARDDPSVIQTWLDGLQGTNPGIYAFLSENPDMVEQLFLGDEEDGIEIDGDQVDQLLGHLGGGSGDGMDIEGGVGGEIDGAQLADLVNSVFGGNGGQGQGMGQGQGQGHGQGQGVQGNAGGQVGEQVGGQLGGN